MNEISSIKDFFSFFSSFYFGRPPRTKRSQIEYSHLGGDLIKDFQRRKKTKMQKARRTIAQFSKSPQSFIDFVAHLERCWQSYITSIYYLPQFSISLNNIYLRKSMALKGLVSSTWDLNCHIFFLTEVEKELYEKALEQCPLERAAEIVSSVRSFPTYFASFVGDSALKEKNHYSLMERLSENTTLRDMFWKFGGSLDLLINLLVQVKFMPSRATNNEFHPNDEFESAISRILFYDHFMEVFLRDSGFLMGDLEFYVDLAERFSFSYNMASILGGLDDLCQRRETFYKPKIPFYRQTSLSCGATCLVNVIGLFFPSARADKTLEEAIEKAVKIEGYFNNIPSSLAKVAQEQFGIQAYFFADMSSFQGALLDKESEFPPLVKFKKDLDKVRIEDWQDISIGNILERLKQGHMISYVTGNSPMLHYKLIYGYKVEEGSGFFYVFDPAIGQRKFEFEDMLQEMRNDISLWGVGYIPPENVMFGNIDQTIKKNLECLSQ